MFHYYVIVLKCCCKLTWIFFCVTEQLRNELMSKHKTELDKLTEGFNSQINHLKQEIAQINTLRVKMVSWLPCTKLFPNDYKMSVAL